MVSMGAIGAWAGALSVLGTGAAQAADDPIQAAFVVLGDDGAAQARVITAADACPAVKVDGKTLPMSPRARAATMPLRPTRSSPDDSKPSAFPVLTCEAMLPAGAKAAAVGAHRLPVPIANPTRIVVIGDTGCRLKKSDNGYQACNDAREYPFARIAASAAAWKPDLVVHVGDYLYRENACPSDRPGCAGSVWGYGWDGWDADFFAPGQPLLAAAPWVAARGNHESCDRAGQGWWRFIEPRPLVAGRDCNDAKDDDIGNYDAPYAVPLGQGGQIIVIDSSNTSNRPLKPDSRAAAAYRGDWAQYAALAAKAPHSIMVDHHPLLGFAATQKSGSVVLNPGNGGLQSVFGAFSPTFSPPNVQMLLSGHVHVWEAVSFSSPHPLQFVAGFSGTQEDIVPLPRTLPAGAAVAPGAVVDSFSSWVDGFGFMTMTRLAPDGWDVEVHDVNGKVVNHCKVTGAQAVCDTPRVVAPRRP
jgi:hypothetical protein